MTMEKNSRESFHEMKRLTVLIPGRKQGPQPTASTHEPLFSIETSPDSCRSPTISSALPTSKNGKKSLIIQTSMAKSRKRPDTHENGEEISTWQQDPNKVRENMEEIHPNKRMRAATLENDEHSTFSNKTGRGVPRPIRVQCQVAHCSSLYIHKQLLPPDSPMQRQPLYVCPECREDYEWTYRKKRNDLVRESIESADARFTVPSTDILQAAAESGRTLVEIADSERFDSFVVANNLETSIDGTYEPIPPPTMSPLTPCLTTTPYFSEQSSKHQTPQPDLGLPVISFATQEADATFNPSKDARYTGNNSAEEIRLILWEIDDAISDYITSLDQQIKSIRPPLKELQTPLKYSMHIDHNLKSTTGKAWYMYPLETATIQEPYAYTPLTATMRAMLRVPEHIPFVFSKPFRHCRDLTFNPVVKSFLNWFVFDILQTKVDILGFPHLKVTKSVLSSVRNAGDERYSHEEKILLLREVRLRTSFKSSFEEELHRSDDAFTQKLVHFLKPITAKIEHHKPITPASARRTKEPNSHLKRIIFHTLKLWWYLDSLHSRVTFIDPDIGALFDEGLHKCFNRKGLECSAPPKEMKIKWVLRKGLGFCNTEGDESTLVVIKAHVAL